MLKQVILVREDLKISKGKLSAQVAHSCVEAVLKSNKKLVLKWRLFGQKKVVLKVKDENELLHYKDLSDRENLTTALIRDCGLTEVKPNTITALCIGPEAENKIDKITKELKTL